MTDAGPREETRGACRVGDKPRLGSDSRGQRPRALQVTVGASPRGHALPPGLGMIVSRVGGERWGGEEASQRQRKSNLLRRSARPGQPPGLGPRLRPGRVPSERPCQPCAPGRSWRQVGRLWDWNPPAWEAHPGAAGGIRPPVLQGERRRGSKEHPAPDSVRRGGRRAGPPGGSAPGAREQGRRSRAERSLREPSASSDLPRLGRRSRRTARARDPDTESAAPRR